MANILFVDCERCTLCGLCVMICSFRHEGEFNPLKARITVNRVIPEGLMVPNVCWQCESPAPCEESCPVEAISRNETTGTLIIDHEECTLCEICIESCPYDNIRRDPDSGVMIKCDLCGGDPKCVKFCLTKALIYDRPEVVDTLRQESALRSLVKPLLKSRETATSKKEKEK